MSSRKVIYTACMVKTATYAYTVQYMKLDVITSGLYIRAAFGMRKMLEGHVSTAGLKLGRKVSSRQPQPNMENG